MFYLINTLLGIKGKEFKVIYIELELTMFVKFLSCFDDIRYILDDGINSLAYFHKDVRSQ